MCSSALARPGVTGGHLQAQASTSLHRGAEPRGPRPRASASSGTDPGATRTAAPADDLGHGGPRRGDERRSARQGLEGRADRSPLRARGRRRPRRRATRPARPRQGRTRSGRCAPPNARLADGPVDRVDAPAGLAREDERQLGRGSGHTVERGHEVGHRLAGLERAHEQRRREGARRAGARMLVVGHGPASSGPGPGDRVGSGRDRRRGEPRTPGRWARTARPGARRSVGSRTRWHRPGAPPTRMARRNTTTLLRSCHSGWSRKVRSWTVTTRGSRECSGMV